MTLTERHQVYLARRICRAEDQAKFIRKNKVQMTPFLLELIEALPRLLNLHCIALAEAIAVAQCGGSPNRFNNPKE